MEEAALSKRPVVGLLAELTLVLPLLEDPAARAEEPREQAGLNIGTGKQQAKCGLPATRHLCCAAKSPLLWSLSLFSIADSPFALF